MSYPIHLALLLLTILPSRILAVDKTVNPALDAQLLTAGTHLDRLSLLPADKDYLFDFTAQPSYTFSPGSVVNANAATFPAVVGNGLSIAMINLGPCGMLPPHYHPRASNYLTVTSGTVEMMFIMENGARVVKNTLKPGMMMMLPQASVHTMVNIGCTNAQLVSALSAEDAGTQNLATALFNLPSDIVNRIFSGTLNVNATKSTIPPVAAGSNSGTEECLKKCNLPTTITPTPRVKRGVL